MGEEEATADMIEEEIRAGRYKRCPSCTRVIQRTQGCDHMTCRRERGGCGAHFCFVCGTMPSYLMMCSHPRPWPADLAAQEPRGVRPADLRVVN